MENGAKGVEVIISGKLRAQRAKAMKFRPGGTVKKATYGHIVKGNLWAHRNRPRYIRNRKHSSTTFCN